MTSPLLIEARKAIDDPMGVKKWVAQSLTTLYHGEDAAREAKAALRFEPSDVATLITLVRIRTAQGDDAEAARLARQIRALAPGAPAVERALGEALISAGNGD